MRRVARYTILKESYDDMKKAGRYNPCLEITFRDKSGFHTHKFQAGYEDDIHVFRKNGGTFVLSQNHRLEYVGLELFQGDSQTATLFFQNGAARDVLGKMDLAPFTIIRWLLNYIYPN